MSLVTEPANAREEPPDEASETGGVFARLHRPGSPGHAALLRVALGLHLAAVFASPSIAWLARIEPSLHPQARIVGGAALFELIPASHIELVATVGVCASLALVLGLFERVAAVTALATFLVTQAFWFGATLFHDDWVYFTFPLLVFCLVDGPSAFSIDAWRKRAPSDDHARRASRTIVEAWVFWIGAVYGAAGIAKLFPLPKGVAWLQGEAALEFAIEFVRESPFVALTHHTIVPYDEPWPFMLGAVLTVVLEVGALSLWLTRKTVVPLAIGIAGMHVAIWWIGIPGFIGMFSVLALALLPTKAFRALDARWAKAIERRARADE